MMSLPFRVVRAMGLALACLILLAGAALAQTKYKLRSGDTLTIEVLEDASLNRTVLVLPGGSINFPLVGPVQAGGRTVDQVRQSRDGEFRAAHENQAERIISHGVRRPSVFLLS